MQTSSQTERQRGQAEALQRARLAIQNGRAAEAERLARDILGVNSGHLEATKLLGYALVMQNRADEAVAPLEKAARGSRDPEAETQLAIALRHGGDNDKALLWLKRAVKRVPPFAAAFHELGYLLCSLKRYDEAIDVLKQGMAAAPMMPEMAIQLGFVASAANDRASASGAFTHALAINPAHPEALHGFGILSMNMSDYRQAAELFRRAVSANPDDTLARVMLGNCLLELGDRDAAYALLRAASARGGEFYSKAMQALISSSRGRFWLRPSAAAKFLKGSGA